MTTATHPAPAAVRIRHLTKSFGDLHVLRGVDLQVERGTVQALLGPNGAGKTTLVRILATVLAGDAGTAEVDGHDVAGAPGAVRRVLGLTGQFAAVDEVLTGRENLALIARLRHLPDPRGIAEAMLRRFSLQDAADRRAGTWSGGMRRRLDIAMSLIGDPAVIVLDEPTTGLDPFARQEVWATIRELVAGGTSVLLTTQDLDEAAQLADRIAILHEGRILQDGTLADLRRLLPPTRTELVEKQPSLEDVFFALVGDRPPRDDAPAQHPEETR